MNIQAVSKFNIYQNKTKSYSKGNIKLNNQQDSFQSQKSNPSFTAVIQRKKIFKSCNAFLLGKKDLSDPLEIYDLIMNFYLKEHHGWIEPTKKLSETGNQIALTCEHELGNFIMGKVAEIILSRNEAKMENVFIGIKNCANKWSILEKWHDNPQKTASVNQVIAMLSKTVKNINQDNITLTGNELLENKNVKNPFQLYNLLSQPLLNAIKYGEDKPFEIAIEEAIKDGKKTYYASFINPENKPIPDNEIDKILEGNHYRASNAKESQIKGTGFGFSEIIRILQENGYEQDIPNLIEKGRDTGVCVRVPLVGIE